MDVGNWGEPELHARGRNTDGVPAATEPSTSATMLLSFDGLGFAGYRTSRKRAALAA